MLPGLLNWVKLMYGPFVQSNLHHTLNFFPDQPRRNQMYLLKSIQRPYCLKYRNSKMFWSKWPSNCKNLSYKNYMTMFWLRDEWVILTYWKSQFQISINVLQISLYDDDNKRPDIFVGHNSGFKPSRIKSKDIFNIPVNIDLGNVLTFRGEDPI